jgi:2'-5' RNA ligase
LLTDESRRWIESVRHSHDPQAARIRTHFTLVFPCAVEWERVAAEADSAAACFTPFDFKIVDVCGVPDRVGSGAHVFLVPDEQARQQLVALHDRLYAGALRPFLARDILYIPHITIAGHGDLTWCQGLADEIAATGKTVQGRVQAIELIDLGSTPVKTLRVSALSATG